MELISWSLHFWTLMRNSDPMDGIYQIARRSPMFRFPQWIMMLRCPGARGKPRKMLELTFYCRLHDKETGVGCGLFVCMGFNNIIAVLYSTGAFWFFWLWGPIFQADRNVLRWCGGYSRNMSVMWLCFWVGNSLRCSMQQGQLWHRFTVCLEARQAGSGSFVWPDHRTALRKCLSVTQRVSLNCRVFVTGQERHG